MDAQTVLVDGVPVFYLSAGNGPPLVMVHGLVGSASNFDLNLPALAQTATVYALDLPNMGRSGRRTGLDAGLEASADRLARFMDMVGVTRADVLAHSHGGAICMMLAARHPEKVKRLVLFAPANPFDQSARWLMVFYNSWLGTRVARMIPCMPRWVLNAAHRRMYVDKSRATGSALASYMLGMDRISVDHVLKIVKGWWSDMAKLQALLGDVAKVPTLLIWGSTDPVVRLASGRRLSAVLGAKLVVVDGTGHLPFAEKAQQCDAAVVEWLRGGEKK